MITKIESISSRAYITGNPTPRIEYWGLSTDTKPTDARNGDLFIEMDTKKLHAYDADGSTWCEL